MQPGKNYVNWKNTKDVFVDTVRGRKKQNDQMARKSR